MELTTEKAVRGKVLRQPSQWLGAAALMLMSFFVMSNASAQKQQIPAASNMNATECMGSPIQYFTNARWRQNLRDTLASSILQQAGTRSFANFVKALELGEFNIVSNELDVSFSYHEGSLYVRSAFTEERDQNSLHFKVEYAGNAYAGSVNPIDLRFILSPSTSYIEGVQVLEFTGEGRVDLSDSGPNLGCLLLLFNNPAFSEPVMEGEPEWVPINPFAPFTDTVERCLQTRTVFGCSTLPGGSRQCTPTTVMFWEMCSTSP